MPRRTIDPILLESIRTAYLGAATVPERKRVIKRGCKTSGYTYGALMRVLNLKVRPRSLSGKEQTRIDYFNTLGKLVWDYQIEHASNTRMASTSVAIRALKDQKQLPEEITYHQISASIRRQRLKNKSQSYFTRFERTEPLAMIQMDFTRSVYLEHIRKDGVSFLRTATAKGANARQERVWIAVSIDDSSRVAYARYYLVKGESASLARHFLLQTTKEKTRVDTDTGEIVPIPLLQGQPRTLYTDRGSAFRNASFRGGIRKLGIGHVLGSTIRDTEGNRQPGSNKQARGKVERMIRYIKEDFETELFLSYKRGTIFTLREINRLLQRWLIQVNTSRHPERKDEKRWEIFHPALTGATYPPKEAELLFSSSVWRKVNRRQVRVSDGVYCKVPVEINLGTRIEIVTVGGNHYTMIGGKRVLLEPVPVRKRGQTQTESPKEFEDDYLEGMALRIRLNREIEERTRGQQNLGTMTEEWPDEVSAFVSKKRSAKEIKQVTTELLLAIEPKMPTSMSIETDYVNVP
ncbi:MAG: transposase family protein [Bacteroidetes bacterium]|nr:transposase family protein [Bacteroidota bacterium]